MFLSADWPLDENEGADGDVVLALEIPDALFVRFELVEEGKTYREAMIPAAALNEHRATLRRLSEDEIDTLTIDRQDSFLTGRARTVPTPVPTSTENRPISRRVRFLPGATRPARPSQTRLVTRVSCASGAGKGVG